MGISYAGKGLVIEEMGEKIFVIGDLHLGYEEILNRAGVFITRKMFEEMINGLERIFEKIGKVDKIILLGDVKHDFGRIVKQEWNDVLGLIDYLEGKLRKGGKIIIIKGNHDGIIGPIAKKREIEARDFYIF